MGQIDNLGQDEPVNDNALTNALIHLREPNETKSTNHLQPKERNALNNQDKESLIDETIFVNVLISSEGHPPYVPLSPNLGLKYKRRMLYFPMCFGEHTIDGLVDNGAFQVRYRKIKLLTTQSIIKEGPPPSFQMMVANGQLETPKATVELNFEVGDIEFHPVMDNLTGPIIGLLFFTKKSYSVGQETRGTKFPVLLHAINKTGTSQVGAIS